MDETEADKWLQYFDDMRGPGEVLGLAETFALAYFKSQEAAGSPLPTEKGKVLVSLSCTMCPDTVIAAQHIAAKNENVTAEIYDIHHFDKIRKKYNVMSVPCILINDSGVSFGKKNIEQILELIG